MRTTLKTFLRFSGLAGIVLLNSALASSAFAALSPVAMDRSLALGRQYLLNSVQPNGSITYEMDARRGVDLGTRNSIREMGGLWCLAALHRHQPTKETADAILRALRYQNGNLRRTAAGGRYLCEPNAREGSTHTMALHVLTLLDFVAADFDLEPATKTDLESDLADSAKFLMALRLPGGRFSSTFRATDGVGVGTPTSYSDGEALLALTRWARSADDAKTRDAVLESAAVMYGEYVRAALRADPDSEDTKGFYQWGSMAFYELFTAGWPGTQPYAARTVAMARWMIDVHGLGERERNTGYAVEGLAVAWELARLTKDSKGQQHIGDAIEKTLNKLMAWQIGSPTQSELAVPKSFNLSPKVIGGIVNKENEPTLRIDIVQHQIHATLLARLLMFQDDAGK